MYLKYNGGTRIKPIKMEFALIFLLVFWNSFALMIGLQPLIWEWTFLRGSTVRGPNKGHLHIHGFLEF